jgi:hypothetical protein
MCVAVCVQAWTFNTRAAIVIGVTERNTAVQDKVKLHRLQQLLTTLVEKSGDDVAVAVEQVGCSYLDLCCSWLTPNQRPPQHAECFARPCMAMPCYAVCI